MMDAMPTSACEARTLLFNYVDALTAGLRSIDAYATIQSTVQSVVAETASVTTVLAVGATLLLAPAMLGSGWLLSLLWLVAAMTGAVGAVGFLQSTTGVYVFESGVATLSLGEASACIAAIALVAAAAISLGSTAHRFAQLSLFIAGAGASGYAAFYAYDLLSPIVSEQLAVQLEQSYLWVFVGGVGLLGGVLLPKLATALLDVALALLGAVLVAQALLQLVVLNKLLAPDLAAQIGFDRYFAYYQVCSPPEIPDCFRLLLVASLYFSLLLIAILPTTRAASRSSSTPRATPSSPSPCPPTRRQRPRATRASSCAEALHRVTWGREAWAIVAGG